MDERSTLLRAVLESPWDDVPRLVYADWLDEHGRGDLAEFIRGIFNPPAGPGAGASDGASVAGSEDGTEPGPQGRREGRLPYGLARIRPGAATATVMPGGGGAAGSVLA